jgi:hypothetical protein
MNDWKKEILLVAHDAVKFRRIAKTTKEIQARLDAYDSDFKETMTSMIERLKKTPPRFRLPNHGELLQQLTLAESSFKIRSRKSKTGKHSSDYHSCKFLLILIEELRNDDSQTLALFNFLKSNPVITEEVKLLDVVPFAADNQNRSKISEWRRTYKSVLTKAISLQEKDVRLAESRRVQYFKYSKATATRLVQDRKTFMENYSSINRSSIFKSK